MTNNDHRTAPDRGDSGECPCGNSVEYPCGDSGESPSVGPAIGARGGVR